MASTTSPTGPSSVLNATLKAEVAAVSSPCTTTSAPPCVVSTPYKMDTVPSAFPSPPCIALFKAAAAVLAV